MVEYKCKKKLRTTENKHHINRKARQTRIAVNDLHDAKRC